MRFSGESLGAAEDQARARVMRNGLQNLAGLFGGKRRILLQQPCRMGNCDVERPNGLRSAAQWNIPRIPMFCCQLMRSPRRRIVKSATTASRIHPARRTGWVQRRVDFKLPA
jgi:hypothetical protein